ncbi:hypothetical protein C8Q78DRAFT_1083925 [Trametes maxima]|nr:hypothetical protein C8Q78DRAFT_1083925 [Trametes maxima]
MKSTFALVCLLAAALGTSALRTPNLRARQDANGTADSPCDGATLVSSQALVASAGTVQLNTFSCAPIVPAASHTGLIHADGFSSEFLALLERFLWYFFPHPRPKTTTKVSTRTATTTATATATVSATVTEVSTATATTTETHVETATVTVTGSAASPSATFTNVCGEICTNVCGLSGSLPPTSEDCQALVNSIVILQSDLPPTFDVLPGHVQTIEFGTCRFFFENVGPIPLEYCWRDLGQTASAAGNACFPPVQPVMSEGLCIPSSALWEVGAAHS